MIIFLVAFLYSSIDVPIGAYNHPGAWVAPDARWTYYRQMLDSAIACGLGYFKPGFLPRGGPYIAETDSALKITSEYPLEQVFALYPCTDGIDTVEKRESVLSLFRLSEVAAGVSCAALSTYVLFKLIPPTRSGDLMYWDPRVVFVECLVGSVGGATLGVALINKIAGRKGSTNKAIIGALTGFLVGTGIILLVDIYHVHNDWVTISLPLVLPAIGASIGYHYH